MIGVYIASGAWLLWLARRQIVADKERIDAAERREQPKQEVLWNCYMVLLALALMRDWTTRRQQGPMQSKNGA
jgi:hypothetical protein